MSSIASIADRVDDDAQHILRRELAHAHRVDDLLADQLRIAERREVDPHDVVEALAHAMRELEREARLAAAARAGDREQPRRAEERRRLHELAGAAEERGEGDREFRQRTSRRWGLVHVRGSLLFVEILDQHLGRGMLLCVAASTPLPPASSTRSTLRPASFFNCSSECRDGAARRRASGSRRRWRADGSGGDAVEVAADADVILAGDLHHVLDVVGDVGERRGRDVRGIPRSQPPSGSAAHRGRAISAAPPRHRATRSTCAISRRRTTARTSPSRRRRSAAAASARRPGRCAR
jgi:hypothetical protein